MKITINNQVTEVQATTLQQLAEELALPQQGVAMAIANRMVPRAQWAEKQLNENDSVVVIKAASGG